MPIENTYIHAYRSDTSVVGLRQYIGASNSSNTYYLDDGWVSLGNTDETFNIFTSLSPSIQGIQGISGLQGVGGIQGIQGPTNIFTLQTVTNSNDPGIQGTVLYDGDYAYFCIATDTWKRMSLQGW